MERDRSKSHWPLSAALAHLPSVLTVCHTLPSRPYKDMSSQCPVPLPQAQSFYQNWPP